MKQLINVVTTQILRHVQPNDINIVRLQNFDNPIIYKSICENLLHSGRVSNLVPKLTLEKYTEFEATHNPNWMQSINYLHKGYNHTFDNAPNAIYAEKSFVDFDQAITKWRNESPNLPLGSLVLLMGTEAAPDDAGSLRDTAFVISPRELIQWLQNDYSEWFVPVLSENSIDTEDARRAIHTILTFLS